MGDRTTGKTYYGDISKQFWREEAGKEYDPEKVAGEAWSYLEKTGVVARIQETQRNKTCAPQLRIVAVNPVIVLIQPCPHPHFKSSETIAHGTRMAMELWLGSIGDSDLFFDEPMQWLSSDLKVGPTDIEFSPEGVAEVPIRYGMRSGKLKLTRAGEKLQIIRE